VRALPKFTPIQRQQSVWRDIAVVAGDGVTHDALMQVIGSTRYQSMIRSSKLFDLYKPAQPVGDMQPGERSLSVRLELLDAAAPLSEERINAVVGDVIDALGQRLGVRLRG
jgi:phenylalanyl-tRNA synthetase beta chain